MATILTYQPDKGVSFNDALVFWGINRKESRALLDDKFEISDSVIDFSKGYNDDKVHNIIQRRDIYKNYREQHNFFFLNFDPNDRLIELEVHHGFEIHIKDVRIDFTMNIEDVAALLNTISSDKKQTSEGEYFFKDLKLTISNSEAIGGSGNLLSYFYCTNDIKHLIDY